MRGEELVLSYDNGHVVGTLAHEPVPRPGVNTAALGRVAYAPDE